MICERIMLDKIESFFCVVGLKHVVCAIFVCRTIDDVEGSPELLKFPVIFSFVSRIVDRSVKRQKGEVDLNVQNAPN